MKNKLVNISVKKAVYEMTCQICHNQSFCMNFD